ncbi:MAG: nickel-type superoxide dismutase maturation protease [Cyanobacteria bacterium Co-bin8]|nr:nickel-type superoxide dismutase maturation protease [Cyanobacteria bacterium Co-bin8]
MNTFSNQPDTLRHSYLWDVFLWLLRRRRRFRVVGQSMLPLLQPGEEVLVDLNAYSVKPPCSGDIVVARQPQKPDLQIVKWVVRVEADGRCYLQGLNLAESTDSRSFGLVPLEAILGRVVCRFP